MKKKRFSLADFDQTLIELVNSTNHKIVGIWALQCARRVLGYFTARFPDDDRPLRALDTLQDWIDTGDFKMVVIRQAALASHAGAREVGEDSPARSAARAAGQAVAAAHVRTHAIAAANYALQAIHRAANRSEAEILVEKERIWQKQCLLDLIAGK